MTSTSDLLDSVHKKRLLADHIYFTNLEAGIRVGVYVKLTELEREYLALLMRDPDLSPPYLIKRFGGYGVINV